MERYLRTGVTQPVIGDWAAPPPEGKRGFALDADHVHLTGEALLSCRAAYYGMINHLDDQISRYLMSGGVDGTTGEVALMKDTIIIFTSDHGEMLGDHYLYRKTAPYDGSARIPLIVWAPEKYGLGKGAVCDEAVCLEDLMPIVAGCDYPAVLNECSV